MDLTYEKDALRAWNDLRQRMPVEDIFQTLEGGILAGELKITFLLEGVPRHDNKSFPYFEWNLKSRESDAFGYLDFERRVSLEQLRKLIDSYVFTEEERNVHSCYSREWTHADPHPQRVPDLR